MVIAVRLRVLTQAPYSLRFRSRDYLAAMRAAANFAFVNRTVLANDVRRAFTEVFGAGGVGMRQVYDVAHNVAKEEQHALPGGGTGTLLVHRKGATRAFPPGHPAVPARYASIGQPVLVGGSMSTSSYVLVGTAGAMERSFGSTCHGAGRALSRAKALRTLSSADVLHHCEDAGIEVRVQTRRLAAEEAAAAYKDVEQVVQTCHDAGISRLVAKLRPVISVKG
jgi:tRNA-splicing ligase RtcB